jgi:AmiR/NasT family two-component response regulator
VSLTNEVDILERREHRKQLLRAERRSTERSSAEHDVDLAAADAVRLATELLMRRHGLQRDRAYTLLATLAHHKDLRIDAMADRFVAAAKVADQSHPGR